MLQELFRKAVPYSLHFAASRLMRARPLQKAVDPHRDEKQRTNIVHLSQTGERGCREIVRQVELDLTPEAAEQLHNDRVAETGGVPVSLEVERVKLVAVPREHLMTTQRRQELVALGWLVRKRRSGRIDQAHLCASALADGSEVVAGEMEEPVVIADHVVNSNGHRRRLGGAAASCV